MFIKLSLDDQLQGSELVEEGVGQGQSTLFLLSRERTQGYSELRKKMKTGVIMRIQNNFKKDI